MLQKVGQGNFGTAFKAQSEVDRKFYIIKVLGLAIQVIRNEKSTEQK
jgi:hypothetical protein